LAPAPDRDLGRKSLQPSTRGADLWKVGMPRREGMRVTRELNVLALFKGTERFIFVYDDDSRDLLIDEIRHKAADPATPINWFDAAVLTERVRNHQETPQEEF
jgi:hypothetical protein